MDPRQIAFVRIALQDELVGFSIPPEILDSAAVAATKATLSWMIVHGEPNGWPE